ncbi:hypothetical protein [Bacillus sp. JCM 19034]|uniref:hypothetical protein n=1 Tax=Bacillus sp. JCM 19034 TaxID=1481928 RepID=UPI0007815A81|nr:hypothetical protein [Bacillus sp. JCM 19034]
MKKPISIILSLIAIVILTMGIYLLIITIQEMVFVPNDYVMWTFNYPTSRLIFIYELYLLIGFFYILYKKESQNKGSEAKDRFIKMNRNYIFAFIASNIVLFYIIVSAVTVITSNKIIDYSFLYPQGREFSYKDVVKISTGVYGDKFYLPFTHSKGEFFYIIELADGKKVHLNELGGVMNDEHVFFIIEELDREFVNMGIPKVSSMENFQYTTEHLDEIYTDKIQSILENTN